MHRVGVRERSEPPSCPGDPKVCAVQTHCHRVIMKVDRAKNWKLFLFCFLFFFIFVIMFWFCFFSSSFLRLVSPQQALEIVRLSKNRLPGQSLGREVEKTGANSYPAPLCSLSYQRGLIISQRHRWNTFSTVAVYWGACLKLSSRCLHFCTRGMFQGEKL